MHQKNVEKYFSYNDKQQMEMSILMNEYCNLISPIKLSLQQTYEKQWELQKKYKSAKETMHNLSVRMANGNLSMDDISLIDDCIAKLEEVKETMNEWRMEMAANESVIKQKMKILNIKHQQFFSNNHKYQQRNGSYCYQQRYPYSFFPSAHSSSAVNAFTLQRRCFSNICKNDSILNERDWRSILSDQLMIDYFCKSGYFSTAEILAKSTKLQNVSNYYLYEKNEEAIQALKSRDPRPLLQWLQNVQNIGDMNCNVRHLQFLLHSRMVVQLIHAHEIERALAYIQIHLNPFLLANEARNETERKMLKCKQKMIQRLYSCVAFFRSLFVNNPEYYSLMIAKGRVMRIGMQMEMDMDSVHSNSESVQELDEKKNENEIKEEEEEKYFESETEMNANILSDVECVSDLHEKWLKYMSKCKLILGPLQYRLMFKSNYHWSCIQSQFWSVFRKMFGMNEHSMLEYICSTSLQTMKNPRCNFHAWNNRYCVTCVKMKDHVCSQLTDKSNIRGITFDTSYFCTENVRSKSPINLNDNHNRISNHYQTISQYMLNFDENGKLGPHKCFQLKDSGRIISDEKHLQLLIKYQGLDKHEGKQFHTLFIN